MYESFYFFGTKLNYAQKLKSKEEYMKSFFLGLLVTLPMATAFASDSTWLICKNIIHSNPHNDLVPVISIFEHRNGGQDRKTEIYFIYGGHLLTGSLANINSGKINLKSPSHKDDIFKGTININYAENRLYLDGDYITFPDSTHNHHNIELTCESMSN